MTGRAPRILVTTGDPAGIGAEIALKAAVASWRARIVAIGDRDLLTERAARLAATQHQRGGVQVQVVDDAASDSRHRAGVLPVIHRACEAQTILGVLNPTNSSYVIGCIDAAVDLCLARHFDAMVTGPVNKAAINDAGIKFSGHTEWIARRCAAASAEKISPVMMLANGDLRVCLLTDHLPLAEVPHHLTAQRLTDAIHTILADLCARFNIARPTLGVCGLNPHAGEGGYLGTEEIEIITPTLDKLRAEIADGARLVGPLPADTAFTPTRLQSLDAVLAMYHDQGLPVIKHAAFGATVNITLGLPIIRTSVDHGTALDLADTFQANESSMQAALNMAIALAQNDQRRAAR